MLPKDIITNFKHGNQYQASSYNFVQQPWYYCELLMRICHGDIGLCVFINATKLSRNNKFCWIRIYPGSVISKATHLWRVSSSVTDSNEAPFVEIPSTEFPYGIILFLNIHLQQYTKLTYNKSIEITFFKFVIMHNDDHIDQIWFWIW